MTGAEIEKLYDKRLETMSAYRDALRKFFDAFAEASELEDDLAYADERHDTLPSDDQWNNMQDRMSALVGAWLALTLKADRMLQAVRKYEAAATETKS